MSLKGSSGSLTISHGIRKWIWNLIKILIRSSMSYTCLGSTKEILIWPVSLGGSSYSSQGWDEFLLYNLLQTMVLWEYTLWYMHNLWGYFSSVDSYFWSWIRHCVYVWGKCMSLDRENKCCKDVVVSTCLLKGGNVAWVIGLGWLPPCPHLK